MVALLEMAARDGVEAVLAERLEALLAAGELPDVKRLREEFAPRKAELPQITVEMPAASKSATHCCRARNEDELEEGGGMDRPILRASAQRADAQRVALAGRSDDRGRSSPSCSDSRGLAGGSLPGRRCWRTKCRRNGLLAPHRTSSRRIATRSYQDAGQLRFRGGADAVEGPCHGAGQRRRLAGEGGNDPDLRPARCRQEPRRMWDRSRFDRRRPPGAVQAHQRVGAAAPQAARQNLQLPQAPTKLDRYDLLVSSTTCRMSARTRP